MISIRSILRSASVALLFTLVSLYTAQALATPNESRLIQKGTAFELGDDQVTFREAAQMRESPDGRFVYALQLTTSQVLVFERDLTTGELSYRSRTSLNDLNIVNDMLFLAEGRVVAFLSYSYSRIGFYYRNEDTGALTLAENLNIVTYGRGWGAAKSLDERFVYFTGHSNLGTYVYEFQESPLSFTQVSHHSGLNVGIANRLSTPRNFTMVSADGSRFYVAAATDQLIRVYDIDQTTGQLGTYIDYPTPDVRPFTILFSPDERHLYVGSQSGGTVESSLHIFDVDSATGGLSNFRTVNVPDVNLQLINSLAQTPDGKFIFAGNASNIAGTGVIWFERDVVTGDLTFKLDIKNGVDDIAGISPVWSLMASADNKNWYAASGNGTTNGISKFFTFQLASITLDLAEPHLNFIPNIPVRLAGDLSIDVDIPDNADTVDGAVVRISGGFEAGDMLTVTAGSGIAVVYDSSAGVLTLSGEATAADYTTVLQTLALTAVGDANDSREVSIEVSYENVTSNTLTVTLTLPTFTVSFLDWDGSLLKEETVQYGNDATAPASPTRDNHQFSGWDIDFTEVTADLDVKAQYDINTFTVRFLDWDGAELSSQTIDWNTAATAPADPTRDGHTFSGWSTTFGAVTDNLDVTAQYDINTYTVNFVDHDDTVLKSETVEWNTGATAPANPTRTGYTFTGWDRTFNNITADTTVTAEYDINVYTVTFLGANDTELSVQQVEHGEDASAPAVPFTPGFLFQNSWDHAFNNVTSDLTVRAEFKRAFMVLNYSIDDAVGVYIESDTEVMNGAPVYKHTDNNFRLLRPSSSYWELSDAVTGGTRYGTFNTSSDTLPTGLWNPHINGQSQIMVQPYQPALSYQYRAFSTNNYVDERDARGMSVRYVALDGQGFDGVDEEDFVVSGKVNVSNMPAGYRVAIDYVDANTVKIRGLGNDNSVALNTLFEDIDFAFQTGAFVDDNSADVLQASTQLDFAVHGYFNEIELTVDTTAVQTMSVNLSNLGSNNLNNVRQGNLTFESGAYAYAYVAQPVQVNESGTYLLGQLRAPLDTVMLLYRDEFDPMNPGQNLVSYNDDWRIATDYDPDWNPRTWLSGIEQFNCLNSANLCPTLQHNLEEDVSYIMVISHFTPYNIVNFQLPQSFFVHGNGEPFFTRTVSLSAGANGSVPAATVTARTDQPFSVTVTPDTGYQPAEAVTGSCAAGTWAGNVYTIDSVQADCSLGFSFEAREYTLTIEPANGEEAAQSTHAFGSAVPLNFRYSRDGHDLIGWNSAANGTGDTYTDGFSMPAQDLTLYAQWEIHTFDVRFLDWNGAVLDEQVINWNQAATAPSDPSREGYTFTGWDATFDAITANLDVTAQYEINTYTVTFVDHDDTVLKSEMVNWNTDATAPANPTRTGYTFTGWDRTFNNVTADMTVKAEYEINVYSVTFLGANDTELSVQQVEHGQDASAPVLPFTPGFLFQNSWDHAFTNVTSDLTVRAEFKRAFMVLNYSVDEAVGVYIESDTLTSNGSPVYVHTDGEFRMVRNVTFWELFGDAAHTTIYGNIIVDSATPPTGNWQLRVNTQSQIKVAPYQPALSYQHRSVTTNNFVDERDVKGMNIRLISVDGRQFAGHEGEDLIQSGTVMLSGMPSAFRGELRVVDSTTLNLRAFGMDSSVEVNTLFEYPELFFLNEAFANIPAGEVEQRTYGFNLGVLGYFEEFELTEAATSIGTMGLSLDRLRWNFFDDVYAGNLAFESGPYSYAYVAQPFEVETSGIYLMGQLQAPLDTVMLVYRDEFDPANPGDNLIGYNDDMSRPTVFDPTWDGQAVAGIEYLGCATNPNRCPSMELDLEAEQTYVMVMTHYLPEDSINFDLPQTFFVHGNSQSYFTRSVALSAGENGSVPRATVSARTDRSFSVTVTPDTGYQPAQAVTGSCPAGTWAGNVYTIDSVQVDCSLGFSFEPRDYTLTIEPANGEAAVQSLETFGSSVALNFRYSRDGHDFVGWNTAADGSGDTYADGFSMPAQDLTLYAQWEIHTFTVRFLDWNGTELSSQTIDWNTAATAPASPTRAGHTFTGWDTAFNVITADLDVTAQYEIHTFTVQFFNWDGRLLDTQTVDWNTAATAPTTPEREGYDFTGWDKAFDAVRADIDVTATFSIKVFRVEFLNDDGGILSIQNVIWRQAAVPPISPSKEGYDFVGWDKPYDSITSDIIIYAQYERIMLTVEAVVQKAFGFGFIDPASQRIEYGGDVEFRAHVGARYRVKSVSTDCGVEIDVERVIYRLSGITESCKVEFEYERRSTSILHLLLGADQQQGSGAKP